MIGILLQIADTTTKSIGSSSGNSILPGLIGGGLAGAVLTFLITTYKNRIQKMCCHYVDDDVITRMPVVTEQGEHLNIYAKEFKLRNTTNKDIGHFKVIFEFEVQSKILKHDTFCKTGKNSFPVELTKENECVFTINNFNRGDECKFKFDIANITQDIYNVTEAESIGFKIIVKDKRKPHKKNQGKIVKKEVIQQ